MRILRPGHLIGIEPESAGEWLHKQIRGHERQAEEARIAVRKALDGLSPQPNRAALAWLAVQMIQGIVQEIPAGSQRSQYAAGIAELACRN